MLISARRLPWFLAGACLALAACGRKGTAYGDNAVNAIRESKAFDARGDMQSIAIAVTSWVSSDGNLADATDFATLVSILEPAWLRVVPKTDPWGTPYQWTTDGTTWELRSAGRDAAFGNADDTVMRDGQVVQLPKSFSPMGPK